MIYLLYTDTVGLNIVGFRPRKCGVETAILLGTGISALGGLGASAISGSMASGMNEEQREWAEKEWSRQFEASTEHENYVRHENQDYQRQLISEERAYNTPAAQAQRLREAGFNPSSMVGSGGTVASTSTDTMPSASPYPTQPSVNLGSMATPNAMGISQAFDAIGSLVKNLSEAEKNGIDTSMMRATINDVVRKTAAEADMAELLSTNQRLENYINTQVKDVRIKKAFTDLSVAQAQAVLLENKGETEKAEKQLKEAEVRMTNALERYHGNNAVLIGLQCTTYMEEFHSRMSLQRAQAGEARAAAKRNISQAGMFDSQKAYTDALTLTENALRQGRIDAQELQNTSYRIANTVGASNMRTFVATESDRLTALIAQYQREGYVTEEAAAKAAKAAKDNDWYEVKLFFDCVGQAAGAVGSVGGVVNAAGKNAIRRRFNELYSSEVRMNESGEATFIERGTVPYGF